MKGSKSAPNLHHTNSEKDDLHSQSTSNLDSIAEKESVQKPLKRSFSVRNFFLRRSFLQDVKIAAENEKIMSSNPDQEIYSQVARDTVESVINHATHGALLETNEEYQDKYMLGETDLKGPLSTKEVRVTQLDSKAKTTGISSK